MADETTVDSTADTAAQSAAPAKKTTARKTAAKKTAAKKATARKTTTRRPAEPADAADVELPLDTAETRAEAAPAPAETAAAPKKAAKKAPAKRAPRKRAATAEELLPAADTGSAQAIPAEGAETTEAPEAAEAPAKRTAKKAAAKKTTAKKATAKKAAPRKTAASRRAEAAASAGDAEVPVDAGAVAESAAEASAQAPAGADAEAAETTGDAAEAPSATAVLFQPPAKKAARRRTRKAAEPAPESATEDEEPAEGTVAAPDAAETPAEEPAADGSDEAQSDEAEQTDEGETPARRRRRRGGRRRRKSGGNDDADATESDEGAEESEEGDRAGESGESAQESGSSRRRRRRRRAGEAGEDDSENPPNTVTKVRESRPLEQQITAVSGSTRLEAKKQRRREGREAGRRRAPIVSEAEFLARRESVDRVMVIRQRGDLTQIGVLEDKVLVEHYVARESQTSLIGNIYLGRVQNVLPSMEAAFIDIGKGRNAVLYAGEVNWSSLGWREGQPRKIESVLTSGQSVLVQVTKDPIGHKGARLTSQISLAGRFLVYVPDGTTSGISRKLPDTERNRLKTLLKEIVPDTAGVIVRTAAEGASEEELTRDVERLKARWDDIEAKARGNAPQLLYGEPDLTLKVVRDLFTEDFSKLVIQGDEAWETVQSYVSFVAPDLEPRLERFVPGQDASTGSAQADAFATYRIDEQIAKGLDRKVWLPSGGSLIIDRTEAMTVIDVNTGKFTGSGGNLEETVTKNNLEAAEEIVRQLRLRDIGGIIVVDFIDMVLESNRDLVLRRMVECLGRDRTRHQVAEVTSLGLVQMTRKRIGTGLLEAFSENCSHCQGRGIVVHDHPVEEGKSSGVLPDEPRRSRRGRGGRGKGASTEEHHEETPKPPSPAVVAAMARHHDDDVAPADAPEVDESARTPLQPVTVPSVDSEPVSEPVSEAVAEAPAEPEAAPEPQEPARPRVVTRTRRGASRAVVTTGEAAVVDAPIAPPAETPAPAAVLDEAAPPAPPKVVTRRRRGASRDVTSAAPSEGADGEAQAGTSTGEGVEGAAAEPVVEHVPIKKRGARKR